MFKILFVILVLYAIATLFLYLKQRDLMYFPTAEEMRELSDVWWFEHQGQRLKIWKIPPANPASRQAILYFGGNAEAVENNIPVYQQLFKNQTVYISNYRGFGGSSGHPTERALFDDALAIYDAIKTQFDTVHIIGRSLGSGVAMHVAAQRPVDKLVLITPYDSILNVAQSAYPMFPVKWLLKDHYASIELSSQVHSSIMVFIVPGDAVVPNKGSERLTSSLKHNPLKTFYIKGHSHGDIEDSAEYQNHLAEFFASD